MEKQKYIMGKNQYSNRKNHIEIKNAKSEGMMPIKRSDHRHGERLPQKEVDGGITSNVTEFRGAY
jgi:hypothetical protein